METKNKKAELYKINARITGILFLIGFAGIPAALLLPTAEDVNNNLSMISGIENQVIIGSIFLIIMSFAIANIAIVMYPILRKYNESIALAAVGFRIIESMLFLCGAIFTLLLIHLSQEFVQADASSRIYFQLSAELLMTSKEWTTAIAGIAFNLGALMYNYIFYKHKLIPSWLSGLGLIAATMALSNAFFVMFGFYKNFDIFSIIMNLPTIIDELSLAFWLIFKGFNLSNIPQEKLIN